jgi:hypothetical protein
MLKNECFISQPLQINVKWNLLKDSVGLFISLSYSPSCVMEGMMDMKKHLFKCTYGSYCYLSG